jgi:uncharacterized protein YpmB
VVKTKLSKHKNGALNTSTIYQAVKGHSTEAGVETAVWVQKKKKKKKKKEQKDLYISSE